MKKDIAIWKTPSISAPKMRDKKMRNTKPIVRVATAKTVIKATACAKVFKKASYKYNMLVKIKLDGTPLIEIARFCGCAPCQILAVNRVKTEDDLMQGQEIFVPVITQMLVIESHQNSDNKQ
jgi:hypothetical protein